MQVRCADSICPPGQRFSRVGHPRRSADLHTSSLLWLQQRSGHYGAQRLDGAYAHSGSRRVGRVLFHFERLPVVTYYHCRGPGSCGERDCDRRGQLSHEHPTGVRAPFYRKTDRFANRGAQKADAGSLYEDFEGTTFPPDGWDTLTAGLEEPYAWHRTTDSLFVGDGNASARVGGESPTIVDE